MLRETDPILVAISVVEMARDERFAQIEELFSPPLRAVVSAATLQLAWAAEMGRNGAVREIGEPEAEPALAGLVRVRVPVTCESGGLMMVMSIDETGLLGGLRIAPATVIPWKPPAYAAPKRFTEQEVMIGSGPFAVPGTLSLPRRRGVVAGVVLLAGGGPFDRDETNGANKPLKDLAWGLVSRGVAVLRFDKVTFARSQAANTPDFTMSDEYIPHAVAAVRLLQQQPTVDPARVFVLGHSMGGKVAPRVAAAESSVAGLVILAGDAQPMQHSAVRVARYLATVNPGPIAQTALESITRQAAAVDSPDLSPSTPAGELPFSLPASYWLDLRGYDPVSTAAASDKPILILQGGRDYQVTVEDDLARWKAGLAQRRDVTIRVYETDNHMFFPGAGPSTPAEYEPAQHVDPVVVADIAHWLAPEPAKRAPSVSKFLRRKR